MKRLWIPALALATVILGPTRSAFAYFGVHLGLQDDSHYGYGVNFGLYTPDNFGLDIQVVSNFQDHAAYDQYFIQENVSLFYDFNHMLDSELPALKAFHPYAKVGFSYGMAFLTNVNVSGVAVDTKLSDGPGISFGVGGDWRLATPVSIGLDLYETVLWLDGAENGGVQVVPDETFWGFNALVTFKFYDFM